MKQVTHGGARPGAGRPKLPKKKQRVKFSVRIDPATAKAIEAQALADGISQGEVIDRKFGHSPSR